VLGVRILIDRSILVVVVNKSEEVESRINLVAFFPRLPCISPFLIGTSRIFPPPPQAGFWTTAAHCLHTYDLTSVERRFHRHVIVFACQ
jgi:hypothetical protein